jgi:hypothetical protein
MAASRPGRFNLEESAPWTYRIEAVWVTVPVLTLWMSEVFFAIAGDRTPRSSVLQPSSCNDWMAASEGSSIQDIPLRQETKLHTHEYWNVRLVHCTVRVLHMSVQGMQVTKEFHLCHLFSCLWTTWITIIRTETPDVGGYLTSWRKQAASGTEAMHDRDVRSLVTSPKIHNCLPLNLFLFHSLINRALGIVKLV